MELINPIWNIFDPPLIDKSIKSYDYKEYKENNVNVSNLDRYEITTKNSQSWKHLSNAYLYVKSKIKNQGNSVVTVSNNGLNDFKLARLFYENKLIEEIDYVGITTTITNLVDFSGDISSSEASQLMWYMDTADSADKNRFTYTDADKGNKVKDHDKTVENRVQNIKVNSEFNHGFLERWQLTKADKTFSKFIPLKRLFRFCRDVNKVLKGEIRIVLEKNRIQNILHSAALGNFDYEIIDLSVWIPEVEPSLSVMATLESHMSGANSTFYGWNAVNCYRSDLENSTSGTWRVVNSQYKVNGIYVAFSKSSRENSLLKSNTIFDNNQLESIHCRVNGKQYPLEEYRSSFTPNTLDYARLYASFLSAGFKTDDQGTCVSYKDFSLTYPVIYFDLTKQEDDPFSNLQTSEIEIRWRLKDFTENYFIYAVIQSERRAEVQVLNHQIYLTM